MPVCDWKEFDWFDPDFKTFHQSTLVGNLEWQSIGLNLGHLANPSQFFNLSCWNCLIRMYIPWLCVFPAPTLMERRHTIRYGSPPSDLMWLALMKIIIIFITSLFNNCYSDHFFSHYWKSLARSWFEVFYFSKFRTWSFRNLLFVMNYSIF